MLETCSATQGYWESSEMKESVLPCVNMHRYKIRANVDCLAFSVYREQSGTVCNERLVYSKGERSFSAAFELFSCAPAN